MFEINIKKRLKQFFCKHNYYAVAVTENYQEIGSGATEKVVLYECIKCEHTRIIRNNK